MCGLYQGMLRAILHAVTVGVQPKQQHLLYCAYTFKLFCHALYSQDWYVVVLLTHVNAQKDSACASMRDACRKQDPRLALDQVLAMSCAEEVDSHHFFNSC